MSSVVVVGVNILEMFQCWSLVWEELKWRTSDSAKQQGPDHMHNAEPWLTGEPAACPMLEAFVKGTPKFLSGGCGRNSQC